jgi:hypothetical protein
VLEIPITGGGKINLTGRVLEHPAGFSPANYPLVPGPDQMVATDIALVRDKEVLGSMLGSASVRGVDPSVGIYVPKVGSLIFMLHRRSGAIEGQAEFGQVRFTLDGHKYIMFSATPITGGDQPRTVWVYRNPNYVRGGKPPDSVVFLGAGNVSDLLTP